MGKKKDNPTAEWMGNDLSNDRAYTFVIKRLEFLCRKSFRYDIWQKRSKIGAKDCPVCSENFYYLKPESHHYPLTLFDIVDNILQHHIEENDLDDCTEFELCDEIMNKHFRNQVDFVVLCKQCHEKYHDHVPDVVTAMPKAQQKQKAEVQNYFNKDISSSARNTSEEVKEELESIPIPPPPSTPANVIMEITDGIDELNIVVENSEPEIT